MKQDFYIFNYHVIVQENEIKISLNTTNTKNSIIESVLRMSLEKKIRNFLQGPKKGETYELRSGLVSQYRNERKDAIQRVIQAMTVGKDVSSLFPDVLKNIATYDLEQKKLVYLYLMNYAKTQPELCILAVNTFVQDTEDPNPLIRALAIRTMGCIRVAKMVDYIEIPLRRTIKDENPYVRKTAAICIAKLYDLDPTVCVELGFLSDLLGLIKDPNPMVIANALSAIEEIEAINSSSGSRILVLNYDIVKSLLMCLNECTEWGRITILTTLNDYDTASTDEANHIIDRVIPQLQHANPSVVLSAIKVLIRNIDLLKVSAQRNAILKKLSAPMVSLVSTPIPEALYVGLKNIRIILEKYPNILSKELRIFFIKYSDPLYLKLEKLEIMVRLATEHNGALLLGELKEYAMEFETSLVVKSIASIAAVAIKVPAFVIKAINLLCELMDERGGSLIVNESVISLTNILRRYPGKNDLITLIVPIFSNHIPELDRNESLCCYAWLLGEYPKYFSNLKANVDTLVDMFLDADPTLQLAILTAIVKISLVMTSGNFASDLQKVFDLATKECENSDVRDKAYIYWRLLSTSSVDAQKRIILPKLPPIETTISSFNPVVLEALLDELSTLSSVYQKPSFTFLEQVGPALKGKKGSLDRNGKREDIQDLTNLAKREIINNARNENLLNLDDDSDDAFSESGGTRGESASVLDELNDIFSAPAAPAVPAQSSSPQTSTVHSSTKDILDLFNTAPANTSDITQGVQNISMNSSSDAPKKPNNELLDLF